MADPRDASSPETSPHTPKPPHDATTLDVHTAAGSSADDRLVELFLRWEEASSRGEPVTPENLCRDSPDLLPALRRLVDSGVPRREALPARVGEYVILDELGRGGMGVVYKARQTGLNRVVALKVIRDRGFGTHALRDRFQTEAEAVAAVRHPNIVQVFAVGEADGDPFLALEYVNGGPLSNYVRGAAQPAEVAARVVGVLGRAVHAAHEAGIVHRDLKPGNVLVAWDRDPPQPGTSPFPVERCTLKVGDFGLAKSLSPDQTQTTTGAVLGTPTYMAPEQARGHGAVPVGPATDVYSLGVILYELVTGRVPFAGSSTFETLQQVLTQEPVPPRRLQPNLSPDVEAVCLKCLEKEPARRYASAADLADDLDRFVAGRPTVARPIGPIGRAWRWCRRNRAVAALLALVFVSLVGGLAGVGWQWAVAVAERAEKENQRDAAQRLAESEKAEKVKAVNAVAAEKVALKAAKAAEDDAKRAKGVAEERADALARALTLANLSLSEQAWRSNLVGQAKALLDECPPAHRSWDWDYMRRLCAAEKRVLRGHTGWVYHVAFAPDSRRLVSTASDRGARVWNADTGESAALPAEVRPTRALFQPDGKRLVLLGDAAKGGKEIAFTDAAGKVEATIAFDPVKDRLEPMGIALNRQGTELAAAVREGKVRRWALPSREELPALEPTDLTPGAVALHLAYSPDGRRVAVTLSGQRRVGNASVGYGAVHVLEVEGGKEAWKYAIAENCDVRGVAFSPDGKWLGALVRYTNPADANPRPGELRVWDAATFKEVLTGRHEGTVLNGLAFHPTEPRVAVSFHDGTVRVFDVPAGRQVGVYRGHVGPVHGVAFSADGKTLATTGEDSTVRLWDATRAPEAVTVWPALLYAGNLGTTAVAWHPDGKRAAAGALDGRQTTVRVYDPETGRETWRSDPLPGKVIGLAYSPDGKRLFAGLSDAKVAGIAWDADGKEEFRFDAPFMAGRFVVSPDGALAAACPGPVGPARPGVPMNVQLWDATTGKKLRTIPAFDAQVWSVAFRPDSKALAIGGQTYTTFETPQGKGFKGGDGGVKLWDLERDKLIWSKDMPDFVRPVLAFSRDGGTLAVGGNGLGGPNQINLSLAVRGPNLRLWDAATGAERLAVETVPIDTITFTRDGKRLATGEMDGTVRLRDVVTGRAALTLPHTRTIAQVAFDRDGRRLASASGELKFWDGTPVE